MCMCVSKGLTIIPIPSEDDRPLKLRQKIPIDDLDPSNVYRGRWEGLRNSEYKRFLKECQSIFGFEGTQGQV